MPEAALLGLAFSSCISDKRITNSKSSSTPSPVFEETPTQGTSPPRPSSKIPNSLNSFLTFSKLAVGLSILVKATIKGISAFLIISKDSFVCNLIPSSAATTRIAISATLAPRERILKKASCPGVSIKVILCLSTSIS